MTDSAIAEKFVKHLEESLTDHLKGSMTKMIDLIVQKRFEALVKQIEGLQKTIDNMQTELEEDRKNLLEMRIDANKTTQELTEIRDMVMKMPKKMESKMEDAVNNSVAEAVPQAVSDTFEVSGKNIDVKKRKKYYLF